LKVKPALLAMMMLGGSPMSVRCRADGKAFADQQCHRGDQQYRGHVVQQCRGGGGDDDEQDHDAQRRALGALDRPDRDVFEDARLAQDADDDHHAEQQEDDIPVDAGLPRVEGVVGPDDAEDRQNGGSDERHGHLVDPVGGDECVGDDEYGNRDQGHGVAG
jgi:hypothetical protein